MTEKNKTCNAGMDFLRICHRQVYDDHGKCICHSEEESKNISLFQKELDKILEDDQAEQFDFTESIFPKKGWSFYNRTFDKDAKFYRAKFSGEAYFNRVRFSGNAFFSEAVFLGEADFNFARFSGKANFFEVQFSGVADFGSTKFDNVTTFFKSVAKSGALMTFDGEQNNKNEMWGSGANFTGFRVEKYAQITFRKVSMGGVQLLESNISRMKFIDVEWPRTSLWHNRRTVADEMIEDEKDYALIAQIYQGLQENYANWYRYLEAGDFFVGEQEMRRKGRGRWGQYFSLNNAYRILSFYGQSMLLPLFWLLGVISIVPGLLMYGAPPGQIRYRQLRLVI